jgi:hypothetical protein
MTRFGDALLTLDEALVDFVHDWFTVSKLEAKC